MNVNGIENAVVGMALFDMWANTMRKVNKARQAQRGDPLVAAAASAFEQYLGTQMAQHTAQIDAVGAQLNAVVQSKTAAIYAMQPGGQGAMPVSLQQMAPFMALNVTA